MNLSSRWKSIFYVAALFLAGGVTGASLTLATLHRRMGPPPPNQLVDHLRERLERRLDLTPKQMRQIDPIVRKLGEEMREVHFDTVKQIGRVIDSAHDQIAAVLTPQQKQKFDAMIRERERFLHDRPPGGRRRPPERPQSPQPPPPARPSPES
jgi:Spy/CpxP family protein refolding chaperone